MSDRVAPSGEENLLANEKEPSVGLPTTTQRHSPWFIHLGEMSTSERRTTRGEEEKHSQP